MSDKIKHPKHYTQYDVEVINITKHLPFCLGNVVKYVLRAPFKNGVEDCNKALQYLEWCDEKPLLIGFSDAFILRTSISVYTQAVLADATLLPGVKAAQAHFLIRLETVLGSGEVLRLRRSIGELREALGQLEE